MAEEAIDQTFNADRPRVWQALQETIAELNYKDVNENEGAGTIEFRTGLSWSSWRGQQMTATVHALDPTTTNVSLTGGVALKVQVTSWGEKKRIAKKVLERVEQKVSQVAV